MKNLISIVTGLALTGLLLATPRAAAQTATLGTTNLVEGPTAGADSVVLGVTPAAAPWTASPNATWLHLAASQQSGIGSTNVIFTFDANPGATRAGTLTMAGATLTVTQAGATYVATGALVSLVSTGLKNPEGVAVDAAGNVYVADTSDLAIEKWSATSGTLTPLVSAGLQAPTSVAVDGVGNVYIADSYNTSIQEWSVASGTLTALVSSHSNYRYGVAVDGAGNVYIADNVNNAIEEWSPASGMFTTLVSSGYPAGVAVDGVGNVYVAAPGNGTVEELLRALVDPTPKIEPVTAGSDALPLVLPATENLAGHFAPASDAPWLTITGVTNGVVSYAFTANPTLAPRTAHLTVLGLTIPITQPGNGPLLTGSTILSGGNFQFTFTGTAGASYSVWFTTNLALPFAQWTNLGAPAYTGTGSYQFTDLAASNSPLKFYRVSSP